MRLFRTSSVHFRTDSVAENSILQEELHPFVSITAKLVEQGKPVRKKLVASAVLFPA